MTKKMKITGLCLVISLTLLVQASTVTAQGPEKDASPSSMKKLKSNKQIVSVPIPPFIITPGSRTGQSYIDQFTPNLRFGPLGPKMIMLLRYDCGEDVENQHPRWIDYCGYEFSYRLNRAFGTYPVWDYLPKVIEKQFDKMPAYTLDLTYRSRIGGMRRGGVFGKDEIGQILSRYKVLDSDGPGNNVKESNLISKKYGLRRTVYVPKVKQELFSPFLQEWQEDYLKRYRFELDSLRQVLDQRPPFRGKKTLDDPDTIYLLFGYSDMQPLEYFLHSIDRDYDAIASEFKNHYGFNLPLQEMLVSPEECAQRIKFWLWVRAKYGELINLRSHILKEKIPNGIVVGNVHFESSWDYERHGEAYDWVGASVRPTLLPENDDLGRLYWVGYGARLFNDLTDKPQMISVRSNTLGGGPRVIPSASSLTYWHNQAIQNGCVGFYIWLNEYPAFAGDYRGICYGNPDKSTLPKIRWNTHMRISKQLGQTKVFKPPEAETVTLVSLTTCALNGLGGWKKVFSSYIELCRAKVWNGFVSDQEIWEGTENLNKFRTIYIPAMIFEDERVVQKILDYVRDGGTVICTDPRVFSYNLNGKNISHYREELFGVTDIDQQINTSEEIILYGEFSKMKIHPYSPGYTLKTLEGVSIVARFPNGQSAVSVKSYGKGKAYLFGVPILDIYSSTIRSFKDIEQKEDRSRLALYKYIETLNGINDQSWIWDITVYNLHQITGWVPYEPLPPDKSIQLEKIEKKVPRIPM